MTRSERRFPAGRSAGIVLEALPAATRELFRIVERDELDSLLRLRR
ncbi:MAG TPA: hypothetical protein VE974_29380 [Thermoanaerobaculia bacterium]|nr:hypothetical protein [Thermoanaerobaculia bacterium]